VSREVFLSMSSVDEARRELVAVVGVVTAAAPLPVAAALRRRRLRACLGPSHLLGGRSPSPAAARRDTTLTTVSTDAVHDAGRHGRVNKRRFLAACVA